LCLRTIGHEKRRRNWRNTWFSLIYIC